MPTTLPDGAARDRNQRRRLLAELVPIAVAAFYLLLLAWSAAGLATEIGVLFEPDQRQGAHGGAYGGEYNPMEPVRRTADPAHRPVGGLTQR